MCNQEKFDHSKPELTLANGWANFEFHTMNAESCRIAFTRAYILNFQSLLVASMNKFHSPTILKDALDPKFIITS